MYSKRMFLIVVSSIKNLSVAAIGALLVIMSQAMNLLPFYGGGSGLNDWILVDNRVALWLQPGVFYLWMLTFLIFAVILHWNLANHIAAEIRTGRL